MTRDDMLEVLPELTFSGTELKLDTKTKSAITREWNKIKPVSLKHPDTEEDVGSSEEEEEI